MSNPSLKKLQNLGYKNRCFSMQERIEVISTLLHLAACRTLWATLLARAAGVESTLFEYYGKNQHLQLLSSPMSNGIHNQIDAIHPNYL